MDISVIICTYGRPEMCRETVVALLPELPPNGEIIVVAQPTPSSKAMPLVADLDKRVTLLIQTEPHLAKARNVGLAKSQGEIVLYVDDDILPRPGLLRQHLLAYKDPRVGGVAGRVLSPGMDSKTTCDPKALDSEWQWWCADFDHDTRAPVLTARGCNMSFRRQLLIQAGGFDPNYVFTVRDDSDMSFRIRGLGYLILYEPTAALVHLDNQVGGTRNVDQKPINKFCAEWRMYGRLSHHYRDNLYFIQKHFSGTLQWRWIWRSYRSFVGVSRWPWRLLAKNLMFLYALIRARNLSRHCPAL